MSRWAPLNCRTDFSLGSALSKPAQIAARCDELNYTSCAITDTSLSGVVSFIKACSSICQCRHQKSSHSDNGCRECKCKKFDKKAIKPILGCNLNISVKDASIKDASNRSLTHIILLAKNLQGWKDLIKITSTANDPEHVYYDKPRLSLAQLARLQLGNVIAISGDLGSDLGNTLFADIKTAYAARSIEEAKLCLAEGYYDKAVKLAGEMRSIFGEANFFIASQRIDQENLPAAALTSDILRELSKKEGIRRVAIANSYYPTKEDAFDQRILLANSLNTTLGNIKYRLETDEGFWLSSFLKSRNYHVPSLEEMTALHDEEELIASTEIAEECEIFDILNKPSVPSFSCPNGLTADEYLTELCRAGWRKKIVGKIPKDSEGVYVDRVKRELDVIKSAKILSDYFLIVQEYTNWARERMLVGFGRGSAAGSLVAHLLNITDIDPIKHDLLFERFYNAGRNTADRVSLPDVDGDFPTNRREDVIAHIEERYGKDRVSQMLTFTRMQGRGAVKDVLRAHDVCNFEEMNRITEYIPDESGISDQLQIMREETGEASIIRWALENESDKLKEWCFIDDDGVFQGQYAKLFEQAIRLEGTKRSKGKHPAGIIISTQKLIDVCPMVYDKSTKKLIAGMEMNDVEAIGIPKYDILGVSFLNKVQGVIDLLRTGEINA